MEEKVENMEEDEEDDDDLWAPPKQLSVAEFIQPGEYLFLPPARYVFTGAEVVIEDSEEEDEGEEEESLHEEEEEEITLPIPGPSGEVWRGARLEERKEEAENYDEAAATEPETTTT